MDTTNQPPSGRLFDDEAAAAYLETTPRHLERLCPEHGSPCIRLGRKVRYLRSDLDAYIAQSRVVRTADVQDGGA